MQTFRRILYISNGVKDETDALKQALCLARGNKASLTILIFSPKLPKDSMPYQEKFETALKMHVNNLVQNTSNLLKLTPSDININIEFTQGRAPAVQIIRHALIGGYDLIIKEVHTHENGKGFEALDMQLIRLSPCPVWLCRPITQHHENMRVAVAIDPECDDEREEALSLRLLDLSRGLADMCNGDLSIISCWDYELEEYVRKNVWIDVDEDELAETVMTEQASHLEALEHLIQKSKIGGNIQVNHMRGRPEIMIPRYVEDNHIDILVMGTLGRTGIPGFFIGNTAENIVQKLSCSLLALKPNGFISPVKS